MLEKFPFQELLQWYLQNGRKNLPWREYHCNEKQLWYRVWLAETMLQQTQVERVKFYFENILHAFPSVEDLAACSYEEFFPHYKWLGYYSRARNMLKTAQKVVLDFRGFFPKETENLRTLPGVGPYTAEAIRAFAYDIPTLSFDTNLEKIFSRYYYGTRFQKLSKQEKEELLEQMREFCENTSLNPSLLRREKTAAFPPLDKGRLGGVSRDINNALMDYGATISLNTLSWIDWEKYPFPDSKFYQTRWSFEPIIEKKKSSFPSKEAIVICILHENHKKYLSTGQAQDLSLQEFDRGKLCTFPQNFSPFLIGKNTGNPRAMIQKYFLQKYNLELSVRPAEIKSYTRNEIPYMICYAQIQSGTHNFQIFENLKVRGFEESLVEGMEFGESLS